MSSGGYPGADEINRTRAGFRRRMREINRLNIRDAKALDRAMKEWAGLAQQDMLLAIVAALLNCYGRLVQRTPVDTGRARAAWQIGTESTEKKPPEGEYPQYKNNIAAAIEESLPSTKSLTEADIIYITNNVEYILALDAGWSRQQAGGFIGLFLQELRHQLEAAAAASAGGAR